MSHLTRLRESITDRPDEGSGMVVMVIGTLVFIIMWAFIIFFINGYHDARRGMDSATVDAARAAATQVVVDADGNQRIDLQEAEDEARRVYLATRPAIRDSWGYRIVGRGSTPLVTVTCAEVPDPSGGTMTMEDAEGCYGVEVVIQDVYDSPYVGENGLFKNMTIRSTAQAALLTFEPSS